LDGKARGLHTGPYERQKQTELRALGAFNVANIEQPWWVEKAMNGEAQRLVWETITTK
jgi:hypothetical protein